MFGPCWGNVSLALDQDNQEFSNFQDWVNLAQGTWKLDKLQFICLLKQVKFFTVTVRQLILINSDFFLFTEKILIGYSKFMCI